MVRYIELAPPGRRLLALLFDGVLLLIFMVITSSIGLNSNQFFPWGSPDMGYLLIPRFFVSLLISLIPMFAYFLILELLTDGFTLGKKLVGIRVAENGRPASKKACVIRNILRVVDYLPASYLVGMISILVDKRMRRLSDIVAGTVVVRWPIRERPSPVPAPQTVYPSSTIVSKEPSNPSNT